MKTFVYLLMLSMVAWRFTRLIVEEDGPYEIIAKFRYIIGVRYNEHSIKFGKNVFADMLCCFACTSIWVSILFTLVFIPYSGFSDTILNMLVVSAGALIIELFCNKYS